MADTDSPTSRSLRFWNRHAGGYDKMMGFVERVLFKDTRAWICRQAHGATLEVAIGTGLNLEHYPREIALTGLEQSPEMLELARRRARRHGLTVDLRVGDALALPFDDGRFDTVVCTFSLCEIPDNARAIAEMHRVLRPGGLLLLADHVASTSRALRIIQHGLELITIPLAGERFLRHPGQHLPAAGFEIGRRERFTAGIVERLAARKSRPGATP